MTSFVHRLTCTLGIIAAATLPAMAEPANWAIAPGADSHTLNFFFEDASYAENLGARLICAHGENDDIVGTSLQIVSDDKNGATAKALVDFDPFGTDKAAQFVVGTTKIPAAIWAFRLEADGLNGAWDLTMDFSDNDSTMIHKLGAATKSDTIQLTVVGQTYDLTPQASDFAEFKKFIATC